MLTSKSNKPIGGGVEKKCDKKKNLRKVGKKGNTLEKMVFTAVKKRQCYATTSLKCLKVGGGLISGG